MNGTFRAGFFLLLRVKRLYKNPSKKTAIEMSTDNIRKEINPFPFVISLVDITKPIIIEMGISIIAVILSWVPLVKYI
jgi:hypothetical protein